MQTRAAVPDLASRAMIVVDDRFDLIADVVVGFCARAGIKAVERLHHELAPRQCRPFGDVVARALRDDASLQPVFDALAVDVAAACGDFGDVALVRQAAPCVRVNPPAREDLVVPFHTDGWAGNPQRQWAIWIPVVDVVDEEGLWITDDATAAAFLDPAARLPALQATMRAAARPVRLRRGEAIVFDANVGHGSIAHRVDRTRFSVDLRVAPANSVRRSGWRPRPVPTTPFAVVARG